MSLVVRERVGLQVDLIKHFLPFLFYCIEGGSQQVNAFILTHLQSFIRQIISAFEKNEAGESRVGFLLDLMDASGLGAKDLDGEASRYTVALNCSHQ